MKITYNKLRQIIQEETGALTEQGGEPGETDLGLEKERYHLRGIAANRAAKDEVIKSLKHFYKTLLSHHDIIGDDNESHARADFHGTMQALLSEPGWDWSKP